MSQVFLYLDESGDLGFDWSKKRTSSHFVITILLSEGQLTHKALQKVVTKTIRNKLKTKKGKIEKPELKGSKLPLESKKYLLRNLPKNNWYLYSVVLDKRTVIPSFQNKDTINNLYNYLTKILLDQIHFDKEVQVINLVVDQCKNSKERYTFDQYVDYHLKIRLHSKSTLNITHDKSHENPGIQLVDLFCWGIARKYIFRDREWYDFYKDKILVELLIK